MSNQQQTWAGCARTAKAGALSSASYETGCARPSCWSIEMKRQNGRWGQIGGGHIADTKQAPPAASSRNQAPLIPGSMYSPMLRRVLSGDELKKHLADHLAALRWEFTPEGTHLLRNEPSTRLRRACRRESLRELVLGFAAIQLGEVGMKPGPFN